MEELPILTKGRIALAALAGLAGVVVGQVAPEWTADIGYPLLAAAAVYCAAYAEAAASSYVTTHWTSSERLRLLHERAVQILQISAEKNEILAEKNELLEKTRRLQRALDSFHNCC